MSSRFATLPSCQLGLWLNMAVVPLLLAARCDFAKGVSPAGDIWLFNLLCKQNCLAHLASGQCLPLGVASCENGRDLAASASHRPGNGRDFQIAGPPHVVLAVSQLGKPNKKSRSWTAAQALEPQAMAKKKAARPQRLSALRFSRRQSWAGVAAARSLAASGCRDPPARLWLKS